MLSCAAVSQLKLSPKIISARHFPIEMFNAVLNEETGEIMEYHQIMKTPKSCELYCKSYSKELLRLAQGLTGIVEGTNTIFFNNKADIPSEIWKDVTYGRVVVRYRPEKGDPYRIRLTVGGGPHYLPQ